jgi:prevent-host-death family protein
VKVPISEFRKNLFQLVDQALQGDVVEVTHKGKTIRLVPEKTGSKLDRLTPIQVYNPAFSKEDHQRANRKLFSEMRREWEKDWSDL